MFCETRLSLAFVNLKPVVPGPGSFSFKRPCHYGHYFAGHSLVISRRIAPRVLDLTVDEFVNMWDVAFRAQLMLEQKHYTHKTTFAIQV